MVTRLSNPPLVPSSMSSGGETHTSELAQTAPGSQLVTPMPDLSLGLMDLVSIRARRCHPGRRFPSQTSCMALTASSLARARAAGRK